MEVDPPEPPCRRRLQTAISCCGPMTMVVNVMVKRRDRLITSSKDGRDECKRTADEASLSSQTTPKPGFAKCPGRSMEDTYLLFMRCPVYRRHDSHSGFRMELENLDGDDKGKGTSGDPTRLKVPMHRSGADCLVVARKRGNARGAKGAGHPRQEWSQRATGGTPCLGGSRQASLG